MAGNSLGKNKSCATIGTRKEIAINNKYEVEVRVYKLVDKGRLIMPDQEEIYTKTKTVQLDADFYPGFLRTATDVAEALSEYESNTIDNCPHTEDMVEVDDDGYTCLVCGYSYTKPEERKEQ